jgi:ribonuclease BN (tRNA processing enzyme)
MCSSYLVEADGYRLMLDCGNGSLSNLQRTCDVAEVDAIIISHMHPDHFADLYGFYYALRFHPDGPRGVPVYAPEGAMAFVAQLLPHEAHATLLEFCQFQSAKAGDRMELGPFTVELFAANHPLETLASRVQRDGKVLAYSGDSAASDEMVACARDADLFVCDSTWLERERPLPPDIHMTGAEAGQTARRAGASRLLVTHVFPTNDPDEVAAEAGSAFDGGILVASDLLEVAL